MSRRSCYDDDDETIVDDISADVVDVDVDSDSDSDGDSDGDMTGGCGCGSGSKYGGAGSEIGDAAAAFGRVYSTIGAVIGVIIAIIMIFLGYSKLQDPHTDKVSAKVTAVAGCSVEGRTQDGEPMYRCNVSVTYTVGGKAYAETGIIVEGPEAVAVGDAVTLQYNPADPASAVSELPPRLVGWGLIAGGMLVGGFSVLFAVLTHRSKAFAEGYGAVEGLSMVGRAF